MSFRFRHFQVEDSHSTMKVGTDAMLLGSWIQPGSARSVLDIGTGCGVLSMMLAQVSQASIHAIDIDQVSVNEAQNNFSNSIWTDRLCVFHRSLEEHSLMCNQTYDLILSNPPFFTNSLKPICSKRLLAKHQRTLTNYSLPEGSVKLMHENSSLYLILPFENGQTFTSICAEKGLFPVKTLIVRPLPYKPPHRILLEFRFSKSIQAIEDELVIYTNENKFSEKYLSLTQNFHSFEKKKT